MADFFEDFGKIVSDVASDIGKKADEALELQKLKSEVRSLKRGNERDYVDIGKAILDKFQAGEELDPDLAALCEAIVKRNEEIKIVEESIDKIKGV